MTASTEQNKALSRRTLAEIDRGNFDVIDEVAAPEFRMYAGVNPPMDAAAFKGFCSMFFSAFPGFKHELEDVIGEGDKVVRVGTFRGTQKHEFMGVPASGKTVAMTFAGVDTYRNGKLVSIQINADFMGLMQQIGAIPAPAHA
jgi:predicted ester cyclase